MFEQKSKAKANAKSQLRPGMDTTTVVQLDDGKYDVITNESDFEPCLEQVVGDWSWNNDQKVWSENPNFNLGRVRE
ncbi:MAG: hypothetical protein HY851_00610 [candidate division Zixibacteria bacterium]|nr:hypothetical protein [candidate division Zixibacteria bacterium]